MLRRYIRLLKKYPLITAAIAIAYAVLCIKTIPTATNFQTMLLRTLLCGAMAFFLYQISGDKTMASSYNSTWFVVKAALGFWIFALPVGILALFMNAGNDYPVWEKWQLELLTVFVMFLFVGLFEEMAFRAVINDAIVYRFRYKKGVFVLSAVCCSLIFGAVHVVGADLSTPMAWVQALGKTVSTGVFGLALLVLYWKTRNIWACGVVHGVYDFLVGFSIGIFNASDKAGIQYVAPDEYALPTIIIYVADTLINLIIFFIIWKKVGKSIDFDKIREEW